jgi:antirestriction protein ArdC
LLASALRLFRQKPRSVRHEELPQPFTRHKAFIDSFLLSAELGAAYLCAEFFVLHMPRKDHAAYIGEWLDVLKADKKAIFTAAAKANEAVGFLLTS